MELTNALIVIGNEPALEQLAAYLNADYKKIEEQMAHSKKLPTVLVKSDIVGRSALPLATNGTQEPPLQRVRVLEVCRHRRREREIILHRPIDRLHRLRRQRHDAVIIGIHDESLVVGLDDVLPLGELRHRVPMVADHLGTNQHRGLAAALGYLLLNLLQVGVVVEHRVAQAVLGLDDLHGVDVLLHLQVLCIERLAGRPQLALLDARRLHAALVDELDELPGLRGQHLVDGRQAHRLQVGHQLRRREHLLDVLNLRVLASLR